MQAGSFHTHPAAIDCTTQAGAALAQPSAGAALRVPAGLALCLLRTEAASGEAAAVAQLTHLQEDGSVQSDYKLQPGRLVISGMLFKPLDTAHTAQPAAAPQQTAAQMLYGLQWLACAPVSACTASEAASRGIMLSTARQHMRLPAGMPAASAAAAVLASLQSKQLGRTVQLTAHPTAQDTAHAACCGLLRVAARELPAATFASLTLPATAAAAPSLTTSQTEPAADVFGLEAAGSFWAAPQLDSISVSAAHHHPAPVQNALVLGGTGDIGTLAGLWTLR